MRIDLRRTKGRMSKHGLDDANISALLQEMRRKAMSKRMRCYLFRNACPLTSELDNLLDIARC